MAAWIWVLIPITAILMGGFKEWLKFKSKQDRLGHSAEELKQAVASLQEALEASEKQREALVRRVQNLETIATSQMWDVVYGTDRDGQAASSPEPPLGFPTEEEVPDEKKAEQLAQRLKV